MVENVIPQTAIVPQADQSVILQICGLIARLYQIRTEFEEMAGEDSSFSNAICESIGCCTEAITHRIENSVMH